MIKFQIKSKRIFSFFCFINIFTSITVNGQNCNFLCNKDFEDQQVVAPGSQTMVSQSLVPCWNTTASDGLIEVWGSGFLGVPSYSGNQFIELNANFVSTLYQDFYAGIGTNVTIGFAHRGRQGVDQMSVSIGPIGGPYTTLGTFSDGNTAWGYYTLNYIIPSIGNYSLRFNSVSASGGSQSVGNFLDFIQITVNPLPSANAGPDISIGACPLALGANLNGSGTGTAPLVYSWLPANGLNNPNIANPVAHPAVTTIYILKVTDANGCIANDSVVVTVKPLPTANAGIDTVIGGCVVASAASLNGYATGTAPFTYSWLPVTGLNNPNIANPSAHPGITTTYELTVNDAFNCKATDSILITVKPLPTAYAGTDTNINACDTTSYASINAAATGTAPLVFAWLPVTGLSNSTILNPLANPVVTTVYILSVTDKYGCKSTDSIVITVDTLLPVSISASGNPICIGASTTLTANGASNYSWSNGMGTTNPITVSPSSTTSYIVTGTKAVCTGSDSITVTIAPLPVINLGNDTTICKDDFLVLNALSPGLTYLWQDHTTASTYTVTHQGIYWVTVTDSLNCKSSDSINVNYLAPPDFELVKDTVLCEGTPLYITIPNGAYTILWDDGNTNFFHGLFQTGIYSVTASNKCGLITNTINLDYKECSCYLYYPNAFTPSGDDLNESFGPVFQCNFNTYHFYIYNRWGQLLFETSDPKQNWDGKFKNEYVDTGVYVWLVRYSATYVIGEQSKYGTVTLIR